MNDNDTVKKIKAILATTNDINCQEIKDLCYQTLKQGCLGATEFCLEHGMDSSDSYFDDIQIDSSLVHSAINHYTGFKKNTLLFLIEKGANIDFIEADSTPLMYLIMQAKEWFGLDDSPLRRNRYKEQVEFLEICKCLVENGANIFFQNSSGTSILEMSKKVDLLYECLTYDVDLRKANEI